MSNNSQQNKKTNPSGSKKPRPLPKRQDVYGYTGEQGYAPIESKRAMHISEVPYMLYGSSYVDVQPQPYYNDALVDRNGTVVPNTCGNGKSCVLNLNGSAYGNDIRNKYKNLAVRYKCLNDNIDPVNSPEMMCEGFTVVSNQVYKSLPPCRKCGGSCPWHWDLVAHRKGKRVSTYAFYTIDGNYVVYNL